MVMVGKIGGGGGSSGVSGPQTAAEYTLKLQASGFATLNFRAAPRVKVSFKTKGKMGNASLASDSATSGDDGAVSVQCNAGNQAADFEVSAQTSDGKEVGRVRVVVAASMQGAEVMAAGSVPAAGALEVARLGKQDPRAALQLLAQHDSTVARALQMGHGSAIESITEPFELARSALS